MLLHDIQERTSKLVGKEQWNNSSVTLCNNKSYKIVTKLINYDLNNVYDNNCVLHEIHSFSILLVKLKIMGCNCDNYKYNLIIGLSN